MWMQLQELYFVIVPSADLQSWPLQYMKTWQGSVVEDRGECFVSKYFQQPHVKMHHWLVAFFKNKFKIILFFFFLENSAAHLAESE